MFKVQQSWESTLLRPQIVDECRIQLSSPCYSETSPPTELFSESVEVHWHGDYLSYFSVSHQKMHSIVGVREPWAYSTWRSPKIGNIICVEILGRIAYEQMRHLVSRTIQSLLSSSSVHFTWVIRRISRVSPRILKVVRELLKIRPLPSSGSVSIWGQATEKQHDILSRVTSVQGRHPLCLVLLIVWTSYNKENL